MLNRPLVFSDFEGQWRIERRIDDFQAKRLGRFEGTARLDRSARGMDYLEDGTLTLEGAGAPFKASRRYHWSVDGSRIRIDFDDGRYFHSFDPTAGRADAVHQCGEDEYRVIYTFLHWPAWRAEWRVRGPRKDYRMVSEMRRV